MPTPDAIARRALLQRAAGLGALALVAPWQSALAALTATPAQTRGPFFPVHLPSESDADLTHVKGAAGRYDHPRDINPAPLDPNFQGYARLVSDDQGRYRFTTVKPGAYPINPV